MMAQPPEIRFVGDTAIVSEIEQDLESITEKMVEVMGNEYNMRINKTKTKVMVRD